MSLSPFPIVVTFMVLMNLTTLAVCWKLCLLQRFGGTEHRHHNEHLDALIGLQAVVNL